MEGLLCSVNGDLFQGTELRRGYQLGYAFVSGPGYSPGTEERCSFAQLSEAPFALVIREPNSFLLEPHTQGVGDFLLKVDYFIL